MKLSSIYLLAFFSILPSFLLSQNWQVRTQIKGTQNETSSALLFTEIGEQLIGGAFSGDIQYDGLAINALGEDDVYLFCLDNNGDLKWSFSGGSIIDDELVAIAKDNLGNTYVCGSYWIEGAFGDFTLVNNTGGKAIFLIKLDETGQVVWGRSIEGSGLKEAKDIIVDEDNNIYLVGYFSDELFLTMDTPITAIGDTDAFFTKWDSDGNLIWTNQAGETVDTRARKLSLLPNGDMISSGIFDGIMTIGDTSIVAGANDWDVFTLRLESATGDLVWLRRAGSVFDQLVNGLDTDWYGNIYLSGSLVGVMPFSDTISIESSTGNPDIFLAKYDQDGSAQWAKVAGGNLTQDVMDVNVSEEEIAICGFSQGSFMIDNFTFSTTGNLAGFAAGFDLDGHFNWGQTFTSNTTVFADQVTHAADGTALVIGSFRNTLNIGNDIIAEDGFDVFVASRGMVTKSNSLWSEKLEFSIFPNPTSGQINVLIDVNDWKLQIWDAMGKLVKTSLSERTIDLSFLDSGCYWIKIQTEENIAVQKLVVQ